jgi:hypothetical protein
LWQDGAQSVSELSVTGSGNHDELSNTISDFFVELRDRTLDTVEHKYAKTPKYAASEFENIANSHLNRRIRQSKIRETAKETVSEQAATIESLYEADTTATNRQQVKFFAQNTRNAVRDASEEMLRTARKMVRDGVIVGEGWNTVRDRIEEKFNQAYLQDRAEMIALMETRNAAETMKLQHFRQADDIVGTKIVNDNPSTPLTESLAGTEVKFEGYDSDEMIQWKKR